MGPRQIIELPGRTEKRDRNSEWTATEERVHRSEQETPGVVSVSPANRNSTSGVPIKSGRSQWVDATLNSDPHFIENKI